MFVCLFAYLHPCQSHFWMIWVKQEKAANSTKCNVDVQSTQFRASVIYPSLWPTLLQLKMTRQFCDSAHDVKANRFCKMSSPFVLSYLCWVFAFRGRGLARNWSRVGWLVCMWARVVAHSSSCDLFLMVLPTYLWYDLIVDACRLFCLSSRYHELILVMRRLISLNFSVFFSTY